MKRILSSVVVGVLSLGLLAGCGGSKASVGIKSEDAVIKKIQERGVLKAGVKVDVPKFGFRDPKTEKIDGFEVDLARAIAKEILGDESKIQLEGVTSKTRGPSLDDGSIDIVAGTFTINDERKKSWNFSDPYYVDHVTFLVRKDSGFKSMKDLNGKTIGVSQTTTTRKAIEAEAQKQSITVQFLELPGFPEVKAALDSKRVDAFSVDGSILLGYLDKNTMLLPDQFGPQEYGVATKKDNTELARVVNDVTTRMLKNGEIDKLLKKWELK